MFYDFNQLETDLIQITRKFGKRQQHGFFTINAYETDDLLIQDFYTERKLTFRGIDIDLSCIPVQSPLGMKILKLAVELDDVL